MNESKSNQIKSNFIFSKGYIAHINYVYKEHKIFFVACSEKLLSIHAGILVNNNKHTYMGDNYLYIA